MPTGETSLWLHYISAVRKQTGDRKWGRDIRLAPSDQLPPLKFYFPKFPLSSYTVPPTGDEMFKHVNLV